MTVMSQEFLCFVLQVAASIQQAMHCGHIVMYGRKLKCRQGMCFIHSIERETKRDHALVGDLDMGFSRCLLVRM